MLCFTSHDSARGKESFSDFRLGRDSKPRNITQNITHFRLITAPHRDTTGQDSRLLASGVNTEVLKGKSEEVRGVYGVGQTLTCDSSELPW